MKLKAVFKKLDNILSWVMLFGAFIFLIFTVYTVSNSIKTGEGAFVFGYRPVYVLSGSMEPYMMTNGMCLTKEVNSIDELEVGDVVTFHLDQNGKRLNITHRIISIENGIVNTKGDNNKVADDLPLTIDNIDAKVIFVFNQSAWVVDKWQTTTGKVMIISFGVFFIMAYFTLKSLIKGLFSGKNKEASEEIESTEVEAIECQNSACVTEETLDSSASDLSPDKETE